MSKHKEHLPDVETAARHAAIEKQAQEGIAAIRAQHAGQVWSNQAQLEADIKPLQDVIARLEAQQRA